MEWSHFLKLAKMKDKYTNKFNELLDTKCD
jgi:hypothetical protein